ncbi:MAG: hypothetical protein RBQ77_04770 [Candidatus Methanomethylophilaceae archaeon]|jgi:hypothetical protein|nr:hypothetical protein [Candidatus Methanomethylophilaceae archaeon]NLF33905.1 hypothetical protein [Thermoplasmatales archaeon]
MQLAAIAGALLAVAAIFLDRFSLTIPRETFSYTGLDLITDSDFSNVGDFQKYMPLLVLIIGILSLILSIIPTIRPNCVKASGLGLLVLGLLVLIIRIVAGSWVVVDIFIQSYSILDHSGIGFWLAMVGGILILLCGIPDMVKGYKA